MIKLAGGVFFTHSRDADARMDILMRCALRAGASLKLLREIEGCVTTDGALDLLEQYDMLDPVLEEILQRSFFYLQKRADDLHIEIILLRNSGEPVAFTDGAFSIMAEE
jgi:cobalt-precorrin-5B (C1)-methyltransferase